MGRNPYTALLALSTVVLQTATTYAMGRLGFGYWWLSLLIAYCIGAFANHANYVIPHDATHNLIFRNKSWNKMVPPGDLFSALPRTFATKRSNRGSPRKDQAAARL